MFGIMLNICWATVLIQAAAGEEKPAPPKGPPPRFITLEKVEAKKSQAFFSLQVVTQNANDQLRILQFADGSQRSLLGTKPTYVKLAEGYKLPFKKARWYDTEGKTVDGDTVWKEIKSGTTVILSADGNPVDPAYLQLFKKDTRILVVPVEDLPVPYLPHVGGYIPIEPVPDRPAQRQ